MSEKSWALDDKGGRPWSGSGERFHNVKHPARFAATVSKGELPVAGSETLEPDDRHIERIMLRLRLSEGVPGMLAPHFLVPDPNRGMYDTDEEHTRAWRTAG